RCPSLASFDLVGQEAAAVRVDLQSPFQRRHRSLVAVRPLADTTRDSDRLVGAGVCKVEIVGIDQIPRMADLASEADGEPPGRRMERAAGARNLARKTEIARAVRRLGQLAKEPAGGLEGPVDVPQRAGATKARELQPRGRVTLGDGPGLVD